MIYIAGPLFTSAEREFNKRIAVELDKIIKHEIFLPQEMCQNCEDPAIIFDTCLSGIQKSDVVVAILDGADSDSGTSWEVGYAFALKKKIIGIRTDFRASGDDEGLNCMLSKSCSSILSFPSNKEENPVERIVDFLMKKL